MYGTAPVVVQQALQCIDRLVVLAMASISRELLAGSYRCFRTNYTMDSHCGSLCFSKSGPTDSQCGLKLYCTIARYR